VADKGTDAGRRSILGIAIASLLATGFGASAGWVLSLRMHTKAGKAEAGPATSDPGTAPTKAPDGTETGHGTVQPATTAEQAKLATRTLLLPPIMTTIANPPNTWLRLEMALIVAAEERGVEEQLAQVADDELSYLRTIEISQIEGPSGLRFLKDDLLDRAKTRTTGKVQDIVIRTMVLE